MRVPRRVGSIVRVRLWRDWLRKRAYALQQRFLKELPTLRTGLVARLIFAFALVVLLAITANMAATSGGLILRTEIRTLPFSPRAPFAAAGSSRLAANEPQPVREASRVNARARLVDFLGVLSQFERTLDRTLVSWPISTRDLDSASRQLLRQADSLDANLQAAAKEGAGARVASSAHELSRNAQALVQQAQARRQAREAYWTALDSLDGEIKGALDQNWKILGRVIARESLLDMSRQADEIRRRSTHVMMEGTFTPADSLELDSTQAALASQLDVAAARNRNSRAGGWAVRAQAALATAIGAREELVKIAAAEKTARLERQRILAAIDKQLAQWGDRLRDAGGASVGDSAVADPAAVAGFAMPPAQTPSVTTSTIARDATAPPASSTPAASPLVRVEHDTPTSLPRTLLRWVTAAILIVLLLLCAGIIHSVIKPIRAFARTVTAFSRGDTSVRFAPAGIRELDVLAEAFNHMTHELTRAQLKSRHYQAELEQRVHERTLELQHLADHDPLTALPNRRQLTCYLDLALEKADRTGKRVAVFFLDLDNFKVINDSMGHAYGDLVLQAIAQRLRQVLPAGAFAGRLGGDEFTVIAEAEIPEQIMTLGQDLAVAFQKPHIIGDRELVIGVSLGASIFPDHEREAAALLRAADAALFSAKSAGRSRLAMFQPALLEAASLKFRIEQGLRRAVERGEFELLFQPEVAFGSMKTPLVEALLRWRQPDGATIAPGEFLTVAEESGLIMTISDWVVRSAVEQAALWYHGAWPEVRVAINVSARQLLDAQFDERLALLLEEYRLPPKCIELELTENVLQTGTATIEMLQRLRQRGVAVALDDFGTGYSSLASLEQLPLTRVKLDRSLIAEIDRQPRALAIARAIITLCRELGLDVTAEGVERPEQLALLVGEPDLSLQGYLLHAPRAAAEIPAIVAATPEHLETLLLALPPRPAGAAKGTRQPDDARLQALA
jgi:diguanylate cyclase (GGDEF)-like protein